jgi:hypothetical protein
MPGHRSDMSRLFERYGLDPAQYLQISDDPPRFATALAASVAAAVEFNPHGRVRDPALRAALLRERLLRLDRH